MKLEAVIAGLAPEGLALILGSAEPGSSAVVRPIPTDPVEFRKCARDLMALSAAKEHTIEERGGGRDPGVRRPGAGRDLTTTLCCFVLLNRYWGIVTVPGSLLKAGDLGWPDPQKDKQKVNFVLKLQPRPGPNGPNASGWCGRTRGPISPLLVIKCNQH